MNMRTYWLKIVAGALAIFAVGFAGINAVRAGKRQVVRVVETASDVTVPLPFVPFSFESERVGTFRKAVFHRSSPNTVEAVDVTVRLADPAFLSRFEGCNITVDDPTRLNERSTFRCATLDSTMQPFGTMLIEARSAGGAWAQVQEVPLILSRAAALEIQGKGVGTRAQPRYEARRMRALGDSMRVLSRQLAQAGDDAAREAITAQIEALRTEMTELSAAMAEAAVERGLSAVTAPEAGTKVVKVEVRTP